MQSDLVALVLMHLSGCVGVVVLVLFFCSRCGPVNSCDKHSGVSMSQNLNQQVPMQYFSPRGGHDNTRVRTNPGKVLPSVTQEKQCSRQQEELEMCVCVRVCVCVCGWVGGGLCRVGTQELVGTQRIVSEVATQAGTC